ncbi:MAG: TIGR00725 family protein [SAR202 cluster bacterium]|nr:TIGR00725 family protein [SAR202 cluster bacterium]
MISVVGAGRPTPEIEALAEQVGAELGRRGITLVCGGGPGVMAAACKGAKSASGCTIGILPGNDPTDANPWVDYPICTGLGNGRNVVVVKSGRAVIAVGGFYGTLSEIALALDTGIPVIGLGSWELRRGGEPDPGIVTAATPAEAVEKALALAVERPAKAARRY